MDADVRSGMDPRLSPHLQAMLEAARDGEVGLLFVDCFKHLSRNPTLLYPALEFVLATPVPVVSHNYLIANGYVARRRRLLRPAHGNSEIETKLDQLDGTVRRHGEYLEAVRARFARERANAVLRRVTGGLAPEP
jgi:hypothetical protein